MDKDNKRRIPMDGDSFSLGAGLSIYSKSDLKNTINITNNRAHYFANLAKKYRDEAKMHCENAKQYAEENSNVTYDQLIDMRTTLEAEINTKQEVGDYALKNELPVNISELENDSEYATVSQLEDEIDSVRLPEFSGNEEKFLKNDGESLGWAKIPRELMFSLKTFDHVLSFEESKGYALQGTWVYKNSAPERYGYPDFYAKCLEEKNSSGDAESISIGNLTLNLYKNPNGHSFYDISEKSVVDQLFQEKGVAWYYGIDEENERIFLPRNNWFAQFTTDVTKVNNYIEAGLPNITGNYSTFLVGDKNLQANGALTQTGGINTGNSNGTSWHQWYLGFDASKSNSIYGKSNTVQPPSLKQLLYIVVGNSEQEAAITKVLEVTISENDTVPLFTGMYFDFKPNNVSWLKAGTQHNSSEIYATVYNTLVNCLTDANNIYDLKVIEESEMELDVDYSKYWKVNQDEMYFITPAAISYQYSDIVTEESATHLYFKVANAVQNLELLNAGAITEVILDKTDMAQAANAAMPSSRFIQLTLGQSNETYVAPSDGYVSFRKITNATNQFIGLFNITANYLSDIKLSPNSNQTIGVNIQVSKNDVFSAQYNAGGNLVDFRFIYANGAESEVN